MMAPPRATAQTLVAVLSPSAFPCLGDVIGVAITGLGDEESFIALLPVFLHRFISASEALG
jgi:hypothetical protein